MVSHTDKSGRGESRWQDKIKRSESHRQDSMWGHTNKTGRGESFWQDRTWWATPTRQNMVSHANKTGRGESHWQDKVRRGESRRQYRMWCHTNKTGRDESFWQDRTWWVTPTRQNVVSHAEKTGHGESHWQDKVRRGEPHRQYRMWCHTNKTGRCESHRQDRTWGVILTRQDVSQRQSERPNTIIRDDRSKWTSVPLHQLQYRGDKSGYKDTYIICLSH